VFQDLRRRWQARGEAAALSRRSIPVDLWKRTLIRYPFLQRRDPAAAAELQRLTRLFLDCKEFSAAGGLRLTDAMAVAIAAQAVLPVLRLGLDRYDRFVSVVVHPDAVVAHREVTDESGIVHEYDEVLSGESMAGGPVTLSWRDVRSSGSEGSGPAYNVVIHEFAHVLDHRGGMPDLPDSIPAQEWHRVMTEEYERFAQRVEAEEDTAMDPYGAENPEEFFAVATESFFVSPQAQADEQPALYGLLQRLYDQDPLTECPPRPRR
jgi:Mlc titration factor MtfA (ptsG expression regulator)